jgi:HlyD family secretion protein
MKRSYIALGLLALLVGAVMFYLPRASTRAMTEAPLGAQTETRIAAPGVVEAASEEITVRAEVAGRLTSVAVEEGEHVARGQIVARLDDALARTRVQAAEAEVKLRQAELSALLNGANPLERREIWIRMKEAEAAVSQARAEYDRRKTLFDEGALAEEEVERAARDLEVAQQRADEAALARQMIAAKASTTDRQRAQAAVDAARANQAEARTLLDKTTIRAPLEGAVVHRFLQPGELAEQSTPILTVADLSRLRVRAEVDEADITSVAVGQRAYVSAPAYGEKKFGGQVVRMANALGRKKVMTGEPSERVDTRVLETLIELDHGTALPLGLRVTCYLTTTH